MNPIVIRLVISLVCAIAIFFALGLAEMAGDQANIARFVIIFIGVAIAALATPSSAKSSHAPASGNSGGGEETGSVKWFNVKKGYGFITRDSGDDIFVHYRNINGSGRRGIADGQRVKFIVIDGDKGLQADEVEAI